MKLANFAVEGTVHFGVVADRDVLDLTDSGGSVSVKLPSSVEEALENWDTATSEIRKSLEQITANRTLSQKLTRRSDGVKFLPPVRNPSKILCVFVNYHTHGQEVGGAPSEPVFFFKHAESIVGDGEDVHVPRFSSKADHEVELGLVMGKKGKDIPPEDSYSYVAGYTVLNDISFRDGMKRGVEGTVLGRNLYRGKVADTSLPMGPFIVTGDEIPEPYPLRLTLKVNGEVRQDGTTNDMIFKIPDLIASASEGITLLPGDVIATGTCSGVGLYTGKYLKDGDFVEAEVEKIGVLRNRVRMSGAHW